MRKEEEESLIPSPPASPPPPPPGPKWWGGGGEGSDRAGQLPLFPVGWDSTTTVCILPPNGEKSVLSERAVGRVVAETKAMFSG